MKRMIIVGAVAALSIATAFGQGHGRKVFKPGETTGVDQGRVEHKQYDRTRKIDRNDYDRTPGGGHLSMTPIAFGIGGFGMPVGNDWAICGLRLNLGSPWWTAIYTDVYGFDIGLSGETVEEVGGIAVNVFNNTTRNLYGIGVAGLWNTSKGRDSHALQVAGLVNMAEGLDGVQIGLVNRAHELHGLQIGLVNTAVNGGGLQIGLWNDCGSGRAAPIIGIVF